MPRGEAEPTFDELFAHLDAGSKEIREGKLYLAQESGTVKWVQYHNGCSTIYH